MEKSITNAAVRGDDQRRPVRHRPLRRRLAQITLILAALGAVAILAPSYAAAQYVNTKIVLQTGVDYDLAPDGTATLLSPDGLAGFLAALAGNDPAGYFKGLTSVQLKKDIDLRGYDAVLLSLTRPRGKLNVNFDGLGHTIALDGELPLFGSIEEGAEVRNLSLVSDRNVRYDNQIGLDAGLLADVNRGRVFNCLVNGSFQFNAILLNTPKPLNLGGVVGLNLGKMETLACYCRMTVIGGPNTAAQQVNAGAICGAQQDDGTLVDCFALPAFMRLNGEVDRLTTDSLLYLLGSNMGPEVRWGPNVGSDNGVLVKMLCLDGHDKMAHNPYLDKLTTTDTDFERQELHAMKNLGPAKGKNYYEVDPCEALSNLLHPERWKMVTCTDGKRSAYLPLPCLSDVPDSLGMTVVTPPTASQDPFVVISAKDEPSVIALFGKLAEGGVFRTAQVRLPREVTFAGAADIDLDDAYDASVREAWPTLPYVAEFDGSISPCTMRGLKVCSNGLFGRLGAEAIIGGLVLREATLYATAGKCPSDEENVYVPIFAAEVAAGANVVAAFQGDVVVDAEITATDKALAVCLVDMFDDEALINGYLYIGTLSAPGDNKLCITIKQNLGTGRNRPNGGYVPPRQKVAVNRSNGAGNRDLPVDGYQTSADAAELVRTFDDGAFRDGSVAYWLNIAGVGYQGAFVPLWSQGAQLPQPVTLRAGGNDATHMVEYEVDDASRVTQAPMYCNDGGDITVTYSSRPMSLANGSAEVAVGEAQSTWSYDAASVVAITFGDGGQTGSGDGGDTGSGDGGDIGSGGSSSALRAVAGGGAVSTVAVYSIGGARLSAPRKGLNVVVGTDGKARLVVRD